MASEPTPYRLIDGQICRIRHDREGNELTQVLANFDARTHALVTRPKSRSR
jgi:hypothetical protein